MTSPQSAPQHHTTHKFDPAPYRYDPERYISERLGWQPWRGASDAPGQCDVLDAYITALKQQHENPDAPVRNRIRIEAGHNIGKTKLASGIVNHFFDCFAPSIIYTFAPTWEQIHDLLWKEIKTDRRDKGLPGRILDLSLHISDNHFAKGRASNNNDGQGTERIQGQHGKYLMFVLDEAEGIADYVWDAVDSMASGGIAIVLLLANPRTRLSRFYRAREREDTANFRISCLSHPNVRDGREVIPGAVRRAYVESNLDRCDIVERHDPERHTFTLPWRPGIIYQPRDDDDGAVFLFRVLGIPPVLSSVDTLVPVGRYEAARTRTHGPALPHAARMGIDVARWGNDHGTLYIRHDGRCWRAARLTKQDTLTYVQAVKDAAFALPERAYSLHIRIDGTGGFGAGVIDLLQHDMALKERFADFQCIEVHFGSKAYHADQFDNIITDCYADSAETLKGVALIDPPPMLEADLCERKYELVNRSGVTLKRLEEKEAFRRRVHRSPDDGDGCVLALASDTLFGTTALRPLERQTKRNTFAGV